MKLSQTTVGTIKTSIDIYRRDITSYNSDQYLNELKRRIGNDELVSTELWLIDTILRYGYRNASNTIHLPETLDNIQTAIEEIRLLLSPAKS